MWKRICVAVGFVVMGALLLGLALPKPALAEEPPLKLISVTGEADVSVKPDIATMSFGVETKEEKAQEAQEKNAEIMTRVVNSLKKCGVLEKDIQTSNFSLYPEYKWIDEKPLGRQVLVGYRCNNQVTVRIHLGETGQTQVSKVLDAAVSAGANTVGGISFSLDDPGDLKDEVLAQAVKNAKSKAEIMAGAAGVTITGVHRISDGYTYVTETRDMAGAVSATPIEAGAVTVRASVHVDFTF